ncbi:hypothetical protein E2320_001238, partial [Naja naja]
MGVARRKEAGRQRGQSWLVSNCRKLDAWELFSLESSYTQRSEREDVDSEGTEGASNFI